MLYRKIRIGDTTYVATISEHTAEVIAEVNSSGKLLIVFADDDDQHDMAITEIGILQLIIQKLVR